MDPIIDLRKKAETSHSKEISGEISPEQQAAHKPAAVTIAIAFIFIGLAYIYFQKNILTAVFFFLTALIILIFAFKEKRIVFWEITRHGIAIDRSFFPHQELKSFWIEYQPGYIKEISLKSRKWYQGYLKIPLREDNPLKIREILLKYLPEERHEDTLIEMVSRKLGI